MLEEPEYTEPIYENVVRIDNVTIIDHRIIRIMNRVHEAPLQIQEETNKFMKYIDTLKKAYVRSIIKRKKAERRYNEAIENYELCEQEYKSYQQSYLILFREDIDEAARKLDQAHIELILTRNILESAERELILQREQLCLLSKKAEHAYIFFLRKTADKFWADMYMHNLADYDEELSPPQFIYQQELLQQNTDTENSDESFEWDATYDEHLHSLDNVAPFYQDYNEFSDGEDNFNDEEVDDFKQIVDYDDISQVDYNTNTSKPLYEDMMIYRRRCALVHLMKPSRLIKYLKNIVHGPWEGWEEL